MPILKLDTSQIEKITDKGGKLVIEPEAEDYLVTLLSLQQFLNDQITEALQTIETQGTSIDANFKGVVGDNLKAVYREYGAKYAYDTDKESELALKGLLKRKWTLDSKAVDDYLKENGTLPEGVTENDRIKKVQLFPDKEVIQKNAKKYKTGAEVTGNNRKTKKQQSFPEPHA